MALLQEYTDAVQSVAARVGPGVVGVSGRGGWGSGFVVGTDRVLTNAHNARGDAVEVSFDDGRTVAGQVVGSDPDADLAVISVPTGEATPLRWADTIPGIGAPVLALANPPGIGLRITGGFVAAVGAAFRSGTGRKVSGAFEHTAPLARGSSGGPVVDESGQVIGIDTNRVGEGFYQAVPASAELQARVDALALGESLRRPRLGVGLVPRRMAREVRAAAGLAERDGLLVASIAPDSPAARAGLRRGDLLVAAGGTSLRSRDDLDEVLASLSAGAALLLTIVRGEQETTVTVSFGPGGTATTV